jgi:hypothetical protein
MTDHTPLIEQQLTPAEIRLAQYAERGTWSTATYNDGTEKALYEIALGLKAEIDRLRVQLTDQQAETAKLIRWHGEDDAALDRMRDTIVRLRVELAEATAAVPAAVETGE